jgi:hypothetical protein
MMGGSWYHEYIGEEVAKKEDQLLDIALKTLKKQINLDIKPKHYQVSVLKVFICLRRYTLFTFYMKAFNNYRTLYHSIKLAIRPF